VTIWAAAAAATGPVHTSHLTTPLLHSSPVFPDAFQTNSSVRIHFKSCLDDYEPQYNHWVQLFYLQQSYVCAVCSGSAWLLSIMCLGLVHLCSVNRERDLVIALGLRAVWRGCGDIKQTVCHSCPPRAKSQMLLKVSPILPSFSLTPSGKTPGRWKETWHTSGPPTCCNTTKPSVAPTPQVVGYLCHIHSPIVYWLIHVTACLLKIYFNGAETTEVLHWDDMVAIERTRWDQ
jgi:hypothetical protein